MANQLVYGFYQLKDYANARILDVNRDLLIAAAVTTREQYNREVNELISLFATQTTEYKTRLRVPNNGYLQALDENGRALPDKLTTYDVELPIQMAGGAYGTNYVTMQKRTVQDVNDDVVNQLNKDRNWIRFHILAALFYNGSGWTNSDAERGNLTIKGLANGDTVTYTKINGAAAATDTHYLAQAGDIATTNPYPLIYADLVEHPENAGGDIITFIPTASVTQTRALADFVEVTDTNIVPAPADARVNGRPGVNFPGRLIGRIENQWIVEWGALPTDYLVSVVVGPGVPTPLAMREDEQETLRGFRPVGEREDYPYSETQWMRMAGFGAWSRISALVTRTGNGTYAIPTSYGSPIW